jgi:diaminopimelate epimerase
MNHTLHKHHGLGNDFLVCDVGQGAPTGGWVDAAQRWCDRRAGIGADGLLLLTVLGDDELAMVLHNADGSRAEMSGNGIRCLAHAAHRAQRRTEAIAYRVHTDAGLRVVELTPLDPNTIEASVDMGEVAVIDAPSGWDEIGADPMRPVAHLSLGNPHTVVGVEDVSVVDLAVLGPKLADVNLEVVEPGPDAGALTMRVHERGAGITQACGTGACATAWAAAQWGLVPPGEITVHMEGGDARVRLHHPAHGRVTLIGPSVYVGTASVPG